MSGCTVLEFGQAGRELVALLHEANERHRELPDEPHPRIDYALTGAHSPSPSLDWSCALTMSYPTAGLAAVVDWIVVLDRSPTTRRLGPAHLLAAELVIPSLAEPCVHPLPLKCPY